MNGVAVPEPQDAPPARATPAVKSADRTVELLELLSRADRRLTLSELHRELSYPKSSLYMLLQTLTARNWVETDRRGVEYGIGVRALLVGTSYLDRDPVVRTATRVLEELRAEVNETVHLARLDGASIVYLASRESQHQLRLASRVGRRLPAHATSLGKAILATRTDAEVDAILPAGLTAMTRNTITDRTVLLAQLAEARERGYSHEREEATTGAGCFAVALPYSEPVTDAISCSVPLARLDDVHHQEQIVESILKHAQTLTEALRTTSVR